MTGSHHSIFHHDANPHINVVAAPTREQVKQHKNHKHLAEAGALAAGAFALHEKHQAKKHPEHAHRHKIEESVAEAVAVGALGVIFHERHEVKHAKKEAKKQHHF